MSWLLNLRRQAPSPPPGPPSSNGDLAVPAVPSNGTQQSCYKNANGVQMCGYGQDAKHNATNVHNESGMFICH